MTFGLEEIIRREKVAHADEWAMADIEGRSAYVRYTIDRRTGTWWRNRMPSSAVASAGVETMENRHER